MLALLGRAQISLEGTRTKPSRAYRRKCHLNEEHLFFSGLALYLRKWELVGEEKGFLGDKGMSFLNEIPAHPYYMSPNHLGVLVMSGEMYKHF